MTEIQRQRILAKLFDAAVELPPPGLRPLPLTPHFRHPIDDVDLLLDWLLGDLSPERHRQLLDHLAGCSTCRCEIATMVRLGILEPHVAAEHVAASFQDADFPAPHSRDFHSLAGNLFAPSSVADETLAHPASEMPGHVSEMPGHVWEMPGHVSESPVLPSRNWRRRSIAVLVTALAACLLLMLGRGVFDFGPRDGSALIAVAQRDLQEGRADRAFACIEDLLARDDGLNEEDQQHAAALLEASGYELAHRGLKQGDFGRVMDIDSRVKRRTAASGRLTNLRIQAERGETAERSLAGRMSLLEHYDYELDGRPVIKTQIGQTTDTDKRIEAELQTAIGAYPDELSLRLNYGQVLLEQRHFARAEAAFAAAVATDPENALAHTGLGLAILEQAQKEGDCQTAARALPHFQAAARLLPDDPVTNQNLAICLMCLGREADAQAYFEKGR